MMRTCCFILFFSMSLFLSGPVFGNSDTFRDNIYNPGSLKPIDSTIRVNVGEMAPDFTLPAVSGETISLKGFRGRENVVLSFVPAAWTPVCSDQWPGYNMVRPMFENNDAVLLGITVDNIPTLYAWTRQMGALWFNVLSDFWPHGQVAKRYGVLRSSGESERALFLIDKQGILRYAQVNDINKRPDLKDLADALDRVNHPRP